MQDILDKIYYGNSVQSYLVTLAIVVGTLLFSKLIYYIFHKILRLFTRRTKTVLDDLLVEVTERPVLFLIIIIGFKIAAAQLVFGDKTGMWVGRILYTLLTLDLAWMISRIINTLFHHVIVPFTEKTENTVDDHLVPLIQKLIAFVIWYIAIVKILTYFGQDPTSLIAGLGLGGLALAMASKDTVSNLFGGLTIIIDRPFKIHDRIKVSGIEGIVFDIGVRCTRIKTDDGIIVTIPNSKFTSSPIENLGWAGSAKKKGKPGNK
jgi:MscS family membrane protein